MKYVFTQILHIQLYMQDSRTLFIELVVKKSLIRKNRLRKHAILNNIIIVLYSYFKMHIICATNLKMQRT